MQEQPTQRAGGRGATSWTGVCRRWCENDRFAAELVQRRRETARAAGTALRPRRAARRRGRSRPTRGPRRARRSQAGEYDAALYFPPDFRRPAGGVPAGDPASGGRAERQAADADAAARTCPARDHLHHGQREIADRLRPALRRAGGVGTRRSARRTWPPAGVPADGRQAVRADHGRRGRRDRPSAARPVVEDPAGDVVALGHDRGLLSGGRPVCRREGTRHAGDAAEQPGRAERDRAGQAADDHALQHGHGRVEPGEHGHHRLAGAGPAAGVRAAAAAGRASGWLLALVPVSALFSALCLALAAFARSTKEGPVLPDAAAAGHHAAGDPADGAGRRAEPGQQPDPGHRRGAAAAERAGRQLLAGAAVRCRRWWPSRWPAACWRSAGRSTSSTPSRSCSARASGSTWGSGCGTCCATASRRRRWPRPCSAAW